MNDRTTLVTGASGSLGRMILQALLSLDDTRLIAGSRTPDRLHDFAGGAFERRRVDFDDVSTLDAAFQGVMRAIVVSTDEISTPGKRQRQHADALGAARRNGVRHLAYTSMPNPESSGIIPFSTDHAAMETAIRGSGLEHSILRNSWYQENLLVYLPHIVRDGIWYTSAANGRIAYVARSDAAAFAAKALQSDRGLGSVDVAGPEALTVEQIAAIVAQELGRQIRVAHVDPAALRREMARQGVPPWAIEMVALTEANQRAGNFDVATDAIAGLLGRKPRSLSGFIRENVRQLLSPSSL